MTEDLLNGAKTVLDLNFRNGHTIPAEGLYPHQWLWDSCFIAIGLAHYDIERAKTEILNLLKGQWSNGMIPHMIFDNSLKHYQDREMWRSYTSPFSPDDVATSGITQPPMLAEAIVRIGKKLNKDERIRWYRKTLPHLIAYHKWLYRERDPKNEGLILLLHPWESGLDSTPPWIVDIRSSQMSWWIKCIKALKLDNVLQKVRRDTRLMPPGQRLSNVDALIMYNLQRKLRHKNYDIDRILKTKLPKIEDVGFNAIFIKANNHVRSIAKFINRRLPESLENDMKHSEAAFDDLWDEISGQYFSFNINTGDKIVVPTVATFLALYSGKISKKHAEKLVVLLKNSSTYQTKYPVPSVPKNSEWFNEHQYWQGPTWININWLICEGLKSYGYTEEANEIIKSSLSLVKKSGFYEYFSPLNGSPAGAQNFSWTAALVIDFLQQSDHI